MDVSKFRNGRVHFRNSGVKGLNELTGVPVDVSYSRISSKRCRLWSDAASAASYLGLHCLLGSVLILKVHRQMLRHLRWPWFDCTDCRLIFVYDGCGFRKIAFYSPHLSVSSRKHAYIILTPLNPTFIYIVKLGFTGVYIIFFISAQKHRLWVLVTTASPRRF